MKNLLIFFILFLLISVGISLSTIVEIDVSEDIKGKIISEAQNVSFNVVKFSTEFYNIGSIAYNARARIFVYENSKLVFSGWSQEKKFMPGDKKNFEIYWYAKPGKYESKLRIYFGNEIIESERKEFEVNESLIPEDIFEIKNFRTYENYVIFDVKSKENAKNVIIVPYKYIPTWIFEQKFIDEIKKGSIKTLSINYYPSIWKEGNLTLAIIAENGKYYSEKTVEMKKEKGIFGVFYKILDSLKLLLS